MTQSAPPRTEPGSGRAIAAIVTCQLMLMVDGVIVTVALPDIRTALGLDTTGLSWVVAAYALAFAGLLLVSGRIGTVVGPRRALLAGVAVFVVASAAGGAAPTGGLLVAARALQGAGAALAAPSILVLISANTADGPARLRAMSWYIIASSAGSAIGLVAGGLLTVTLGWRWVMLVNVPIGLAVIVGVLLAARAPRPEPGRVDVPGAALSVLAMLGLVYGLSRAGQAGWGDPVVLTALAAAVVAGAALVAVERRADRPVVPPRLLRGPSGLRYLAMLLMPAAMIGFFSFSVLLLQELRGLDALQTGLVYLPWAVAVVVGGRLTPRLLPRAGERVTVAIGVAAALAGMLGFAVLAPGAPLWLGVLLPCLVLGFGPALFFTSATNRIMAEAGPGDSGAAAALLQSMQQLGGAVGIAVLATVYTGTAHLGAGYAGPAALYAASAFGAVLLAVVLGTPAFAAAKDGVR